MNCGIHIAVEPQRAQRNAKIDNRRICEKRGSRQEQPLQPSSACSVCFAVSAFLDSSLHKETQRLITAEYAKYAEAGRNNRCSPLPRVSRVSRFPPFLIP